MTINSAEITWLMVMFIWLCSVLTPVLAARYTYVFVYIGLKESILI